jgi:hypothetical protein
VRANPIKFSYIVAIRDFLRKFELLGNLHLEEEVKNYLNTLCHRR